MRRFRVIPVLMLHKGGLYKPVKFKNPRYVGDPLNAVRILNDKEVDEVIILDIDATREKRGPDMPLLSAIASEAFMPMGYGGGLTDINQVKQLFYQGYEKAIFNYSAIHNILLIEKSARLFGSSSTVVSIDVKKNWRGQYRVYELNGKKQVDIPVVEMVKRMESAGAGELFLTSIDREGSFEGYDLELLKQVTDAVSIPVIANAGAGSLKDFKAAITGAGASAVAAGSMFVFQRPHNAVLITYPDAASLNGLIN